MHAKKLEKNCELEPDKFYEFETESSSILIDQKRVFSRQLSR